MSAPSEKRKHYRHPATGIKGVKAKKSSGEEKDFEVVMFDISAGGAGFGSDERLSKGDKVSVVFSVPGSGNKQFEVKGEIVRIEEFPGDPEKPFYRYGLMVTNMTDDFKKKADPSPKKKPEPPKKSYPPISLGDDVMEWLFTEADKKGTSVSSIITSLIKEAMGKK